MNKVDVMAAGQELHRNIGRHPAGRVTHAPYRREPYVRAHLDDGRTIDAKVSAWTRTHVLLHWMDEDGKVWNMWVLATRVRRITAEESGWRDPYDLEWHNRVPKK